ncbi:MAG TPA: o-succinylbenzoate synthase [Bacteroidales bacterium]|nr:o-succinylbenzoate synthase [Bacteroidales bacterium]
MGNLKARNIYRKLIFEKPAGTSRGTLITKDSYFLLLFDEDNPQTVGIGECSLLPHLSPDIRPEFYEKLQYLCNSPQLVEQVGFFNGFPALQMAYETAMLDLSGGGNRILFPSDFVKGKKSIPINGLIWMSEPEEMKRQVDEKLMQGFRVLKLKIGANCFEDELDVLRYIRETYASLPIEIRLDANGAFQPAEALRKLEILSKYDIHSIEQPIKPKQTLALAEICHKSPIPIALDEELIGMENDDEKLRILEEIHPQYIVLKPSLLGGFLATKQWIELCDKFQIHWWITSALEANIGLNALAQFASTLDNPLVMGLGTGSLYLNNFDSPLTIIHDRLSFIPNKKWDLHDLF